MPSNSPHPREPEEQRQVIYSTSHDMTDNGLDVTVATALGEATDLEATDVITDFADYADPDALNRLFRVRHDENVRESGSVRLTIEEYDIMIESDGGIEVLR